MSSAATPAAAEQQHAAPRRRRQTKPPVTRRSAIQLLIGVLIVGAIPIFSTVRILQANALRNEQARADSALGDQLQNGLRELGRLGDNASTTRARPRGVAGRPARSHHPRQRDSAPGGRAHSRARRSTSARSGSLASIPGRASSASIWLTVNGVRAAKIVASVPLGPRHVGEPHPRRAARARRQARPREARPGARRWRASRRRAESYGWAASTTADCRRSCPTRTAPA